MRQSPVRHVRSATIKVGPAAGGEFGIGGSLKPSGVVTDPSSCRVQPCSSPTWFSGKQLFGAEFPAFGEDRIDHVGARHSRSPAGSCSDRARRCDRVHSGCRARGAYIAAWVFLFRVPLAQACRRHFPIREACFDRFSPNGSYIALPESGVYPTISSIRTAKRSSSSIAESMSSALALQRVDTLVTFVDRNLALGEPDHRRYHRDRSFRGYRRG